MFRKNIIFIIDKISLWAVVWRPLAYTLGEFPNTLLESFTTF